MNTGNDALRGRLARDLEGPLSALGLDLEAVELSQAGKRRVLRVAVDKDRGVTIDDLAEADRAVSGVLDESDAMGQQAWTLEVTSRGVDRPLTLPRHWRRNADRLVKVTPHEGPEVTGRIVSSDDEAVTLDVQGTEHVVAYATIRKAIVQIEFNRRQEEKD